MKYYLIFLFALGLNVLPAQKDYTLTINSGKLKISEVNEVTVKGHSGATVMIEVENYDPEENERAAGLKLISPSGLTDNTGIGLYAGEEDGVMVVKAVSLRSDHRYIIKVPKAVSVYYEHSTHEGGDLKIQNVASEVEVSARFNSVILNNASGPLAIHTVHGDIEADFDAIDQSSSISLTSMHGHVDVTIPAQSKATFHLASDWGEMYTDLDLSFESEDDMKTLSTKKVDAKYNGGGVDFTIKSNHSDIYLRKK